MATIKFFTRTKLEKLATVWVRYIDKKTDIWQPTPYKLFPAYWNQKKQEVIYDAITETEQFTKNQARDIEAKFEEIKDFILRKSFDMSGPVTREWLQSVLDEFCNKDKPKKGKETLNEYIKRFVDEAESGDRLTNTEEGSEYSAGTIRALRGFMLSFYMFQGIDTPDIKRRPKENEKKQPYKPLDFEDINSNVYKNFLKYFKKRGCSANYIGKHVKTLKTILRAAGKEKLYNIKEIDLDAFRPTSEKTDEIYLTADELDRIYKLDFSKLNLTPANTGLKPCWIKRLPEVRDIFLVGCDIAQRYSDYSHITEKNIKTDEDGSKKIHLVQRKTKESVIIPISPRCDQILKRYGYNFPKTLDQQMNTGLKVIGKLAKITEQVNKTVIMDGKRVTVSVPKYEMIKTHTARRTGCTLMYLAKIRPIDIMTLSGHRTETEFLKYIKVTKKETATQLQQHEYFTQPALVV